MRGKFTSIKYVFVNQAGKPHSARNLTERRLEKLFEKCEIPKVRWHDLRHTYASVLISQAINPAYVQRQMGHSRKSTTLDIYSHILPTDTGNASDILENVINYK